MPFVVPIAGVVFLANAVWSCVQGYRIRHLQQRVEMLEDAQVSLRTQIAREQLSVPSAPVPVTIPQTVYYPPQNYMAVPPPPYRPQPSAPPSVSFGR